MPITEPVAPAHAQGPIIVPKKATAHNPNFLAFQATAGAAGAGVTNAATRYGYGPVDAVNTTLKVKAVTPMMGVAGADATGAQTADAGVHTVFPSQFAFGTAAGNKYRNPAFSRGS